MPKSNEKSQVNLPPKVVADLLRTGLLVGEEGTDRLHMADRSLSLFLPLLTSFDVKIVPVSIDACPVRFCSGILTMASDIPGSDGPVVKSIPAGGQGRTSESATISCIGELTERISLCSEGKRDARIFTSDKYQPQVGISRMLGLSSTQEQQLARRLSAGGKGAKGGVPDWQDMSDRRVRLTRLGGHASEPVIAEFPATGILFNELERVTGGRMSLASSSGCAVWSDLEGARERALLELVERDAIAQAWYNRLGITLLTEGCLAELLPGSLCAFLSDRERFWRLCIVDTELDAFVVLAFSHELDGRRAAFGSSAGLDLASTCESAIQEMLQAEYSLDLMERAYSGAAAPGGAPGSLPRQLIFARERSILEELPLTDAPVASAGDLEKSFTFEGLLQGCLEKGFEIWEFDATRSDLKVPCIKLLSPDLCSWEPRFGKRRLFEGVVNRGLRATPATESEFAARPFPF
ncbi:YcaO-like family protein [uncultured Roseibium sp.]|uniref:YcaO-like family protein n=1 Tax=uncultured Roseibium sp. TaxID=1936171 RepID=UPI0026360C27|nr:YcaO-like family protein [uncultured Roseibium sp.]